MNTVRKSITITKTNKKYIERLVKDRKARNFSNAIDSIVEEDRRQNEQKNNNSSKDSI